MSYAAPIDATDAIEGAALHWDADLANSPESLAVDNLGEPIRPIDAWVIAAFLNSIFHSASPQPVCQPIEIPCRANRQPEPGR